MLLGDLLSRFTDESLAAEAILSLADFGLLTALRQRAESDGLELRTFAALAVQRYAEEASDEEWVALMGAMDRSTDPGLTCLKRALIYATRARH
jgi:hypothetical protein